MQRSREFTFTLSVNRPFALDYMEESGRVCGPRLKLLYNQPGLLWPVSINPTAPLGLFSRFAHIAGDGFLHQGYLVVKDASLSELSKRLDDVNKAGQLHSADFLDD